MKDLTPWAFSTNEYTARDCQREESGGINGMNGTTSPSAHLKIAEAVE